MKDYDVTDTMASRVIAVAIVTGSILWLACQSRPAVNAARINAELIEAGCEAQGDAAAVAQEMALPNPPPWLVCLEQDGSVQSCNVPCGR